MTFIGYYNCVNAFGIYTPKSNVKRWQGLVDSQQLPVSPSLSQSLPVSPSLSQSSQSSPTTPILAGQYAHRM